MSIFSNARGWKTNHRAILQPGGSPFWCVITDLPSASSLITPWLECEAPKAGIRTPDIAVKPFAHPAKAAELLTDLAPAEQHSCLREHKTDIYCFDGRASLPTQAGGPITFSPLKLDFIHGYGALTTALCYGLSTAGALVLHAGCFLLRGKRVLVLGQSGYGKSTLCAAALHAGGQVVSDDSLLLHATRDDCLTVYPLRRDLSLRKASLGLIDHTTRDSLAAHHNGTEHKWFLLRDRHPDLFLDCSVIDETWVLLPPSDRDQPSKTPIDAAMALRHLMDATHFLTSPRYRQLQPALLPAACRLAEQNKTYLVDATVSLMHAPADILSALV